MSLFPLKKGWEWTSGEVDLFQMINNVQNSEYNQLISLFLETDESNYSTPQYSL